jgi:hypothetical protein
MCRLVHLGESVAAGSVEVEVKPDREVKVRDNRADPTYQNGEIDELAEM